jgi:hypothetical protein
MTAPREPRRPPRGGRKRRAKAAPKQREKPLLQRISKLVERRRKSARLRKERERREQVAIRREKAEARRQADREPARARGRAGERSRARRGADKGGRERKPVVRGRSRKPEPKRRRREPVRARAVATAKGASAAGVRGAKRARSVAGARTKRARSQARPVARTAATRITSFGERASKLLLAAAAPVAAALVAIAGRSRKALAWLAAALTPLRAAVAVTGIAAVLLAVSQFVDYRGVAVGVDDYGVYADVEPVAPAPQVDRREAGEPHSYLLVPVAALALVLLVASVRGRWQLGRVVSLLGLGALAVAFLVDVPAGLDEGEQAIAYASVEAQLLEGFYVEVFSAAVLVVGGLLVSRYARPTKRGRARARRGAPVRRLGARTA